MRDGALTLSVFSQDRCFLPEGRRGRPASWNTLYRSYSSSLGFGRHHLGGGGGTTHCACGPRYNDRWRKRSASTRRQSDSKRLKKER
jgi:hypothetical protein